MDLRDVERQTREFGGARLLGNDDAMAPVENARAIADRIPGARTRITLGGRHGFFDEFSSTVTADVLAFLD